MGTSQSPDNISGTVNGGGPSLQFRYPDNELVVENTGTRDRGPDPGRQRQHAQDRQQRLRVAAVPPAFSVGEMHHLVSLFPNYGDYPNSNRPVQPPNSRREITSRG